jgi:hypothetical protein
MLLYNPDSRDIIVREVDVPDSMVHLWTEEVGSQIICQIELYAYLAARCEYRRLFHNRGVIAWVDNEAARFAASKGAAQSPSLTAMARVIQQIEISHPAIVWIERVCSYSNPADKPSRKQCQAAAQLYGATHDPTPIKLVTKILDAIKALSQNLLEVIPGLFLD